MIKPSEFRNILVDMTGKRIPQLPIDWRSQTSPTLEVSLIELVKLANDCREAAGMLEDFADYVDRLWEIRSAEEEGHLCATCTQEIQTCSGLAKAGKVLQCRSYEPKP
jgi:hypothetical protein